MALGWPRVAAAAEEQPLLPWLDPATSRPLALSIRHQILFDRSAATILVEESRWQLDWLDLNLWDGRVRVAGEGRVLAGRSASLATSITLGRVELSEAMAFFQLPRAREVRAQVSGRVRLEFGEGEWSRIAIAAHGAPGTVFLSRGLIKDLLANQHAGALAGDYVDSVLDQRWPNELMIPFNEVNVEGELTRERLIIRVPLRNELLNLDFNPQIDNRVLWWVWEQLMTVLRGNLSRVDWEVLRDEAEDAEEAQR